MDRLRELVCLSIGRASMCWSQIPKGVFNDSEATKIADELMEAIEKHVSAVAHLSSTEIIRDAQGNELVRRK